MMVAAIISVVVLGVLLFANSTIGPHPAFLPSLFTVLVLCYLITVVLLVEQYRAGGGPRLLPLSWAYTWAAAAVVAHALLFPGVLSEAGLLGAAPSSSTWLWIAWHLGFPLLLAATLSPWASPLDLWADQRDGRGRRVLVSHLVVVVVVAAVTVLATAGAAYLPTIIERGDYTVLLGGFGPVLAGVTGVALAVALLGVYRRRHLGGLEAWALVALVATCGDIILVVVSDSRYTVGWYAGRVLAVLAATAVLVAILREVTVLHLRVRRFAEQFEAQKDSLRDAQALRDHLTAVVSHDMRTPLTGLLGYLEVLRHDSDDMSPEMIERMQDRCRLLARRLTLLTEDLLAVATLDRGELQVSPFGILLCEELNACVAGFPDLEVEVDCPPDLEVVADSLRFQQALTNVIRNAELYGAKPVRVVAASLPGLVVEVRVTDAGPGVHPDFEPHLFERYTRGPGTVAQGSGLGLSVVQDLMTAHGGSVRYERGDNAFVLTLPGLPARPAGTAPMDPDAVPGSESDTGFDSGLGRGPDHERDEGLVDRPDTGEQRSEEPNPPATFAVQP